MILLKQNNLLILLYHMCSLSLLLKYSVFLHPFSTATWSLIWFCCPFFFFFLRKLISLILISIFLLFIWCLIWCILRCLFLCISIKSTNDNSSFSKTGVFMLVSEVFMCTLHLILKTFTLASYISSTWWLSFSFLSCNILSCSCPLHVNIRLYL